MEAMTTVQKIFYSGGDCEKKMCIRDRVNPYAYFHLLSLSRRTEAISIL